MKKLAIILLLFPIIANASYPPFSGAFSNASKGHREYMKPTLKQKNNFIVTVNDSGQQFFIQCFKDGMAGFGVVAAFIKPRSNAVIDAGPECPARVLRIELDYEEAFIRSKTGWAHLIRGNLYVPIVD